MLRNNYKLSMPTLTRYILGRKTVWRILKRLTGSAATIGKGDRISAMMPNMPETVACMLAASSIGAIWSSCSPDFGEQGVIDRFGHIEPKLSIACDAYWYNGKLQNVSAKIRNVEPVLKAPVLVVHYAGDAEALASSPIRTGASARHVPAKVIQVSDKDLKCSLVPVPK